LTELIKLIIAIIPKIPDIVILLKLLPTKILLKAFAFISFFGTGSLMFFFVTDADIISFLDYICNSRLYRFFSDIYFAPHEVDPSINSTKKEEEPEKKPEDSENKKEESKPKNKFFKPESPTEIKVAVIVGAIFGIPYLIYKIFFSKK
jgi:hypothetical protein